MGYKNSNSKKIHPIGVPCRKAIYNSPEDAQDMLNHIRETRRVREIQVYKCTVCGFWHLTSRTK
jgi:hypothetical protein